MGKKVEYGIPRLVDARYGEIILRILPNTTLQYLLDSFTLFLSKLV